MAEAMPILRHRRGGGAGELVDDGMDDMSPDIGRIVPFVHTESSRQSLSIPVDFHLTCQLMGLMGRQPRRMAAQRPA